MFTFQFVIHFELIKPLTSKINRIFDSSNLESTVHFILINNNNKFKARFI